MGVLVDRLVFFQALGLALDGDDVGPDPIDEQLPIVIHLVDALCGVGKMSESGVQTVASTRWLPLRPREPF